MKSIVSTLLILIFTTALFSQCLNTEFAKPAIDTSTFGRWPSAEMPVITSEGDYAFYMIRHQPADGFTLVIRSLKNEWEKEFINASNASFSDDSRKVIFINSRKNLCSLNLGSDNIDSIAQASSYRLIKQGGEQWLIYQLNNTAKELKAINLKSNTEKLFVGVIDYLFSSDGNVLVLLKQSDTDNQSQAVDWINFPSGNTLNIWNGNGAISLVINKSGNQLAMVVETKNEGSAERSIFYYLAGSKKAELLADNHTKGIDSNFIIDRISGGFSRDGDKLFIALKEKKAPKRRPEAVKVDVWSYHDVKLQSMQLAELTQPPSYKAAMLIKNHEVVRLQQEGDRSISVVEQWQSKVYADHYSGNLLESHWNAAVQQACFLISTDNGERQKLEINPAFPSPTSPAGTYLVGRKGLKSINDFFCYDIRKDKTVNISHSISAPFDKDLDDKLWLSKAKCLELGGWLANEEGVILFDRYDMWLVDPAGEKLAINLTSGYGQKHKIVFRLPEVYWCKSIRNNSKIFLKGFDLINKEEGLYSVELGKQGAPKMLVKGPYQYEIPDNTFNSAHLDSSNAQSFLVRRESATQSPNYFLTSDFKTFKPVTDVYPERLYNWLTNELHTWKSLNGETLQGILYKPKNFNPKKKYPIIFHYYERKSDQLNKYLEPEAITDHLNVPWFVSQEYLVFTPDIHYELGKVGESALNSVVSAAHYLQKFPWVDGRKMAIQGHSFGGYETNYIVTHSHLFTAAMSSSGNSDLISAYSSLGWESAAQGYFERNQGRMGATLWERPDVYIKETTIFQAPYVNTPLLMMANKKDEFNFPQQLELFLSLWRLGKRAWLLQYDDGNHTLNEGKDALQHTIRMTQFFDHYLKDSAAPKWMLYGVRASQKGIDNGLELVKEKDPKTGKWLTPPEGGLLTDEEKKKLEKLKYRKPITITLE